MSTNPKFPVGKFQPKGNKKTSLVDRNYDADTLEFLRAVDAFKSCGNPFPTAEQILQIVRDLGYKKTA